MKKLIWILVVVAGLFSFANKTLVQEFKSELAKAHGFYNGQNSLYMHTTVYGIPVKNAKGQVKIGTAEMYRDRYRFYSKALGREMYCEGKKAIVIHHAKKEVTYYQSFDVKRMMKEQALPLDSILKRIDGGDSLVKISGQIKADPHFRGDDKAGGYRLYIKGDPNVYTDMVFDAKDHYLKDYTYTVYTGEMEVKSDYSKIRVHYDQVNKKPAVKIDFNLNRFVEGMGDKMKVNEKLLKGYKLKVKKYYYEY